MVVTLPLRFHSTKERNDEDHDPYRRVYRAARCPIYCSAFELGERTWKLGFTIGMGQRPRIRQIPAGALDRVWREIAEAKRASSRGRYARDQLLRSGARRVLDPSGARRPRRDQLRGGFLEHRSESAGATDQE